MVDAALREGVLAGLEVDRYEGHEPVVLLLDLPALDTQGFFLGAEGGVAIGEQVGGGGLRAHRLPAHAGIPGGGGDCLEEAGIKERVQRPVALVLADSGLGGSPRQGGGGEAFVDDGPAVEQDSALPSSGTPAAPP